MRKNDILLCQVDRNFVMDFEAYLKIEYKLDTNSSEKLMRIFKRITTMCFKNGQMPKDPFCDYKLKKVKKGRGYLTKSELESIIDYKPDNKRLEKVRDIFLFCCFTGFDYSTTAALTEKNLVTDDEGCQWIETHRIKTGTASKVKLLDIPLSIIRKYELKRNGDFLLPVMSNAKYNLYLKEMAVACSIEKRVTSHLARHTFACLAVEYGGAYRRAGEDSGTLRYEYDPVLREILRTAYRPGNAENRRGVRRGKLNDGNKIKNRASEP